MLLLLAVRLFETLAADAAVAVEVAAAVLAAVLAAVAAAAMTISAEAKSNNGNKQTNGKIH